MPATIFGRWAVHQSHDIGDTERTHHGFVVTHVETGKTLPMNLVNHLRRYQAEEIARTLDAAGDIAGLLDDKVNVAAAKTVSRLVYEALAEVDS
ncbi:MAG TPA: hypothetical protein VFO62_10660 [Candidatus Binatia bacterium]|nr:hypothetical protein [Candidatus Binatia bacterium]